MTVIHWFRRDLRLRDNPAFSRAAARGPVLPVFILEEGAWKRDIGGASRWWLHHSLQSLTADLGGLVLKRGNPVDILADLAEKTGVTAIHWNRCLDPGGGQRDADLIAAFEQAGLEVVVAEADLLHDPDRLRTGMGSPFKMFTPFWKACRAGAIAAPTDLPSPALLTSEKESLALDQFGLLPGKPDWAAGWQDRWSPGEEGAQRRLESFVSTGLAGYGEGRDRPDRKHVSRLSPHLHFGEISPCQIWARMEFVRESEPALTTDIDKFLSELGWREFSQYLLYHDPMLPTRNWKTEFDQYPWRGEPHGS